MNTASTASELTGRGERASHLGFRTVRGLVAAVGVALLLLGATEARAADGAWAWAHSATGSYSPYGGYSWNSSGGAISIANTSAGTYSVNFAGLPSVYGGHVQVSAYGGTGYCKSAGWGPSSNGMSATVQCYSAAGALTNSRFTIAYFRYTGSEPYASNYVWDNLSTSSGTPSTTYQWTSTGATLTSNRFEPGSYRVRFPYSYYRQSSLVTAYGSDNTYCRIAGGISDPGASPPFTDLWVDCFDQAGNRKDSAFNFARGNKLIHAPSYAFVGCAPSGNLVNCGGFVRIDGTSGEENNGHAIRTTPGTVGQYSVYFYRIYPMNSSIALANATLGDGGNNSNTRCQIVSWGWDENMEGTKIKVSCHDFAGNPKDSSFVVNFGATHGDIE